MGFAYAKMLIEDKHNGEIYNLVGHAISQSELADYINLVFNTKLKFNSVSVAAYLYERKSALGDFIGTVIAGIYEGIKNGSNNVLSDFELAAGRPHKSVEEVMRAYKEA